MRRWLALSLLFAILLPAGAETAEARRRISLPVGSLVRSSHGSGEGSEVPEEVVWLLLGGLVLAAGGFVLVRKYVADASADREASSAQTGGDWAERAGSRVESASDGQAPAARAGAATAGSSLRGMPRPPVRPAAAGVRGGRASFGRR